MAKVIAPFKIEGTLDDLVFYVDENNINRVKTKGNTGITKQQFRDNPIFQKIRNQGTEFGKAAIKAKTFRALTSNFNNRAKDGSFAGRANKLLLDILREDQLNTHGERTFENGIQVPEIKQYCIGFEGNKLRPIKKVLLKKWKWSPDECVLTITNLKPKKHIDWPENAENASIAIAYSNWNYLENKFETQYSEELTIQKEDNTKNIKLKTEKPAESHWEIVSLFIGFSTQERNKTKELKRSNNSVSIIWTR